MSEREVRSSAVSTSAGPLLPPADETRPKFAGFQFDGSSPPDGTAGVFIFTRRIGALNFPVLIATADDLTTEMAAIRRHDAVLARESDGQFWMKRPDARQRSHISRELIGKFDPPLNVEHRKGRAAPELAALVPDRAGGTADAEAQHLAAEIEVSEDELERLVAEFYAAARADPLIGPVFGRAISNWDEHRKVVQDFWSRTLRGTTRYTGNPFGPHRSLGLKPEFFERWIELFSAVAKRVLSPAAAQRAIAKVEHMSVCFQAGLFLPPLPDRERAHPV